MYMCKQEYIYFSRERHPQPTHSITNNQLPPPSPLAPKPATLYKRYSPRPARSQSAFSTPAPRRKSSTSRYTMPLSRHHSAPANRHAWK